MVPQRLKVPRLFDIQISDDDGDARWTQSELTKQVGKEYSATI